MKKTICLYFQIHQPVRLRKYHFFDIGLRHDYFDDFANRSNIQKISEECYLPMNSVIMEAIRKYGKNFKVTFSISGSALEQLDMHSPAVIGSFRELAGTGNVEFLAETYGHSLASMTDGTEFENQVKRHAERIQELFGTKPSAMRNSSLIYSDMIGERVLKMGYRTMITDGAKHILGWKSPNYVYTNAADPRLRVLLKNSRLSDDITLRFSDRNWEEWPLTADKYLGWIRQNMTESDTMNLFMNYETFGTHNRKESGIFEFFRSFVDMAVSSGDFEFLTVSETADRHQPVAPLHVPYPISWSDEEKDLTSWLGNELQNEAFEELFKLQPKVHACNDAELTNEYSRLQASDHFYYMRTKLFSHNEGFNTSPYESPYDAFINYMNVLSDFIIRVDAKLASAKV